MWITRSCCCLLRPFWSMFLGTVRVQLECCARTIKNMWSPNRPRPRVRHRMSDSGDLKTSKNCDIGTRITVKSPKGKITGLTSNFYLKKTVVIPYVAQLAVVFLINNKCNLCFKIICHFAISLYLFLEFDKGIKFAYSWVHSEIKNMKMILKACLAKGKDPPLISQEEHIMILVYPRYRQFYRLSHSGQHVIREL